MRYRILQKDLYFYIQLRYKYWPFWIYHTEPANEYHFIGRYDRYSDAQGELEKLKIKRASPKKKPTKIVYEE